MPEEAKRSVDSSAALEGIVAKLRASALARVAQTALCGRNIGILCDDPDRPEVFLLQRAAAELGARVSLVRAGLTEADALLAVQKTGKVLGRLYDALICVDVPARIVESLSQAAGVPAIADMAGEWIALRAMRQDAQDDGRYLLQALLVDICA